mmetsp:Transcript_20262/g.47311  ORF Transcript_20262/g.47311 Transcript_20262/m.47311 type:complete len:201 (+) Transcript_20262:129-731(+)
MEGWFWMSRNGSSSYSEMFSLSQIQSAISKLCGLWGMSPSITSSCAAMTTAMNMLKRITIQKMIKSTMKISPPGSSITSRWPSPSAANHKNNVLEESKTVEKSSLCAPSKTWKEIVKPAKMKRKTSTKDAMFCITASSRCVTLVGRSMSNAVRYSSILTVDMSIANAIQNSKAVKSSARCSMSWYLAAAMSNEVLAGSHM